MTPPPIPAEVVELLAKFEHALFQQYPSMVECMGTINGARESLLSAIARAIENSRAPSKAERDGVLEEAAKVCDRMQRDHLAAIPYPSECAEVIRAMKGRP